MATSSTNGFERALTTFRARLSPEEDAQFQITAIDDLRMAILSIQSHQRARKKMIHMKRIESFLEAMEQFGKVIEIFLNATNYLAFVWGPVKLLLLTASTWVEILDELLDAYQRIFENLPLFQEYQTLFQNEPQMQLVLESVWGDILDFHSKALRIFSHSMLHTFFRSMWKDFRSRFQHILDDLAQHKSLVESHANQIHIRQYASDRTRIFQEFERISARTAEEKYEHVLRWLNAPFTGEIQEDLATMRNDFFEATNIQTGQWIITNEKVKNWLDLDVPKTSIIWVHGIPGAGKSVLASVVIDKIQTRAAVNHAFFYCKDGDSERDSYTQILRALLSQLISQNRGSVPYYYDEGIQSGDVSLKSKKLSKKLLDSAVQNVRKGFVVIDGIDECAPGERKVLLEHLIQLVDRCDATFPGKVRLMILSREEPDIKKFLAGSETLKITSRDTLEDINTYVKYQGSRLKSKFSELETEDINHIQECVLDRTDGMFLFAKLVTENLIAQPTIHDLQSEIQPQVFPNGLGQA
ncbi:hypothetical protein Daus18300_012712 [Diaporthe australafricana]|uniref:NACHT domain-containing protein n=1 Tax=Diaporthe australafricana TaxID=127596 RepID=A0ABR3W1Z0_9PEZI